MATRIGVDVGGTFTDLLLYEEATGKVVVAKVPSTPLAPDRGCVAAIEAATGSAVLDETAYFLHGTTVGLNALLERRGAVVGLLVTSGFRDVLELRRGSRDNPYDLFWSPPAPLVPRRLRLGVEERIRADGTILTALAADDVLRALSVFAASGVTSIAVCFMNAYRNPQHELQAEQVLRDAGFAGSISLSHRVSGEYREYERTSTTVVDAFVADVMSDYLTRLDDELTARAFRGTSMIMRSGGGAMSFAEARNRSFETIMSGPAAGASGAARMARVLSLGDLITADVGGTSFDTCLILDGKPQLKFEGSIEGMPLQAPWIDIRSIGAGGGSIASVDQGGLLTVGPRSSGSMPGPACYGRGGTQPTLTDAAFFLGMLGEGKLASGLTLGRELAEAALAPVATSLRCGSDDLAIGIVSIAAASMANAIREITVEQGRDPRRMTLLAFGGAGPLMATCIASELDIDAIVVPPYAGNFSAWGLLSAEPVRSASRTHIAPLDRRGLTSVEAILAELFAALETREGALGDPSQIVREATLLLRYVGQEYSLPLVFRVKGTAIDDDLPAITRQFETLYRQTFGTNLDAGLQVVSVRATLRAELSPMRSGSVPRAHADPSSGPHVAHSFARGERTAFRLVERDSMQPGQVVHGPVVITEFTTTTYVDADFEARLHESGALMLTRSRAGTRQQ